MSPRRYIAGSIVRQFVLAVMAVQAVLSVALCSDLALRQARSLEANRTERAQGLADMLAASSVSWVLSHDSAGLQELVRAAGAFTALRYALVLAPSGEVLAHSDPGLVGREVADPLGRSLLAGPVHDRVLARTDEAIEVAAPIQANGRLVGWVWVSISRADLRQDLHRTVFNAALYTLAALAISGFIAFLVARRLAGGLRQVARVSDQFRHGDRDARVAGRGQDELSAVAAGMNAMLETVSETERALRSTHRLARVGSWRYEVDAGRLHWSPEVYALLGMDPQSRTPDESSLIAGLAPESRAEVIAAIQASVAPEAFSFRLRYRPPGGAELVIWIEGFSEFDPAGKLKRLTGVCQDITEREAAAAQLQQAQKMESVGQLTGGLAHDFNNLLAIIIGNLDLIADELKPEDDLAREFADVATQAALKGSDLTRQLLAFSRRQPLDPKVLDLNGLVAGMDPLWRRTLGGGVTITLSLAPALWSTKVDRSQVESALLNLVINARDAMAGGGRLVVETMNATLDATDPELIPGDYAVIAVSDTGSGMAPEVLARVFEPFFTTKGVGQGSGLGLSMVYGFASQSGGQLKIYSEVGHGTTVRLYLPRAAGAAPVDVLAAPAGDVQGRGERVLVVEDNLDVRRVAVRQMTDLGYVVLEADDGANGLDILNYDPTIDLVFTDIIMPGGMTGIEMVARARANRPALRALFTTGFTQTAVAANARVTGADLMISKPYRRADLAAKLREAFATPDRDASLGAT